MDQEQQTEWRIFERQTVEALRNGCAMAGTRANRLLQLLVLPSFDQHAVSWEIFEHSERGAPAAYQACCTRWLRDIDLAKLATPVERLRHPRPLVPTLDSNLFELSEEFVHATLTKFGRLALPPLVGEHGFGLDGTDYEIALGDRWASSRFRWWDTAPAEWKALENLFAATLGELEKLGAGLAGEDTRQ